MIERLRLRGWRAFDDVTLELGDGLTFVVAESGVGKTSLVRAAGLGAVRFGVQSRRTETPPVGAPASSVEVDLELPDGRVSRHHVMSRNDRSRYGPSSARRNSATTVSAGPWRTPSAPRGDLSRV